MTLAITGLTTGFALYKLTQKPRQIVTPSQVASEFLSCLKEGEATDSEGLMGYERAYGLLTDEIRDRIVWDDFLVEFLMLTQEHGMIQSSEWVEGPQPSGGRCTLQAKLFLGDSTRQVRSEMTVFDLVLNIGQPHGGGFQIVDYQVRPGS